MIRGYIVTKAGEKLVGNFYDWFMRYGDGTVVGYAVEFMSNHLPGEPHDSGIYYLRDLRQCVAENYDTNGDLDVIKLARNEYGWNGLDKATALVLS